MDELDLQEGYQAGYQVRVHKGNYTKSQGVSGWPEAMFMLEFGETQVGRRHSDDLERPYALYLPREQQVITPDSKHFRISRDHGRLTYDRYAGVSYDLDRGEYAHLLVTKHHSKVASREGDRRLQIPDNVTSLVFLGRRIHADVDGLRQPSYILQFTPMKDLPIL